jgi:hypothetical protein
LEVRARKKKKKKVKKKEGEENSVRDDIPLPPPFHSLTLCDMDLWGSA